MAPYAIQVYRDSKWSELQSDKLLPGDVVSVGTFFHLSTIRHGSLTLLPARIGPETVVPADILLVNGAVIVNEAMLSGESTPLLKESIQLLEKTDKLDIDGTNKNQMLFSGTKILQAVPSCASLRMPPRHFPADRALAEIPPPIKTPDGGCLGVVVRTGFGTAQGQLVRTMIFSTERVSANNLESFLFIGFLLIFAIAASWYVWVKGLERGLKKSKLLLDCVLIITSVVPPELPMELSLAVNASLVALSKFGELVL